MSLIIWALIKACRWFDCGHYVTEKMNLQLGHSWDVTLFSFPFFFNVEFVMPL